MTIGFGAMAALSTLSSLGGYFLGGASSSRAMKKQYEYNRMLMEQQFNYQKYLAQHAHQFEVADLREAGLNPVLSANNGATASVGLNSASAIDNSSNMANTMTDSLNTAVQNAVSAKSVNSQVKLNNEQENYLREQATTEQNKRDNLDSQTKFNLLNSERQTIENLYLPDYMKSQIKANNSSAIANQINADANSLGAKASYINATSGNVVKTINDIINNPEKHYNNIKSSFGKLGNQIRNDVVKSIVNRGKTIQRLYNLIPRVQK